MSFAELPHSNRLGIKRVEKKAPQKASPSSLRRMTSKTCSGLVVSTGKTSVDPHPFLFALGRRSLSFMWRSTPAYGG